MVILFVCTGNTCRSPMASAMMNKLSAENEVDIFAESAGIFAEANAPASENAIKAMEKRGIDLTTHRTQPLSDDLILQADLILTMTEAHKMLLLGLAKNKTFTMYEYIGDKGDISDPFGGDLEEYEEVADEIYDVLVDVLEKVVDDESRKNKN